MNKPKFHLIFKNEDDQTSNFTIDWLHKLDYDILVINNDKFVVDLVISHGKTMVIIYNNLNRIDLSEIKSYWMRRGNLHLFEFKNESSKRNAKDFYLQKESKTLYNTIMDLIFSNHGIGRIELNETNKLYNLHLAQLYGLKIPNTCVSHNRKSLVKLTGKKNQCTKAIRHGWFSDASFGFDGPTVLVQKKDFNKIAKISWPSSKNIKKRNFNWSKCINLF